MRLDGAGAEAEEVTDFLVGKAAANEREDFLFSGTEDFLKGVWLMQEALSRAQDGITEVGASCSNGADGLGQTLNGLASLIYKAVKTDLEDPVDGVRICLGGDGEDFDPREFLFQILGNHQPRNLRNEEVQHDKVGSFLAAEPDRIEAVVCGADHLMTELMNRDMR